MKTVKTIILAVAVIAVIASGSIALAEPGVLSASFAADVNTGAAPLTIHFTDSSDGSPTEWHWDFGDGGYSTLQNPTYTYHKPGTFTVTLTVTNGTQSDTVSGNVVVTNPMVTTPAPVPSLVPIIVMPIKDPHHERPPHFDKPPAHKQPPHKDQPIKKNPIGKPTEKPTPKPTAKPTEKPTDKPKRN
jgi:FOG: PKD repeat